MFGFWAGSFKGRKKPTVQLRWNLAPQPLRWSVWSGKSGSVSLQQIQDRVAFLRCSQIQNLMIPSWLSFRMQESQYLVPKKEYRSKLPPKKWMVQWCHDLRPHPRWPLAASLPRRTYELPLLVSTTEWNKPGSTKKGQAITKHPRSKTQRSPAKQFIAYIYIPYV